MSSPRNDKDFDKELALMQLVGYLELAAETVREVRKQLDELAEKMKAVTDE